MPIDSKARAFIEANIEHYREVTLAVKAFEAEVEAALRSIWREFKPQLDAVVAIPKADPSFVARTQDGVSEMILRTGYSTGIQVGVIFQCRDDDDGLGRLAVCSWVWVNDKDLRTSLDNHVATQVSSPFVHEFKSTTTYIRAYMDLGKKLQAIDLLHDGFKMLFECLFGSPEFCKAYNVSGPVDTGNGNS